MPSRAPAPTFFHAELKNQLPVKQAVLAREFGLTSARISQILNNASDPPLWMLLHLFMKYNVDVFEQYFRLYKPSITDKRTSLTILNSRSEKLLTNDFFEEDEVALKIIHILRDTYS